MLSIFISYSRRDEEFANELSIRLRSQGLSVWIDKDRIKVGQKISQRIKEGVINSDYFLIVISKDSVNSNWVKEELDSAHYEAISNKYDSILPILLDDVKLPKEIQNLKYADFRGEFEKGFQELIGVFELNQDDIEHLSTSEGKKKILKLLSTTDKWGELPAEIVSLVEDESYLPIFEDNLIITQKKQIIYNSIDAITWLADYDYDHRIIKAHSSIPLLISLYKETRNLLIKEKIIRALATIGSKLSYDFLIKRLNESNPHLKAEILTGLWSMSISEDFSDWNITLVETFIEYLSWPIEKCLYFDFEKRERDFRFWVFRCLSETGSNLSIKHIENFVESNAYPPGTLAEAASTHWHLTKTTKYIDILKNAEEHGVSCSAGVTLEEIKKDQMKNKKI